MAFGTLGARGASAARPGRPCRQRVHAGVRAHSFFSGGPAIAVAASASFVRVLWQWSMASKMRAEFSFSAVYFPAGAARKRKRAMKIKMRTRCPGACYGTAQKMRAQKKTCRGELHASQLPISVVHENLQLEIQDPARRASSTTRRRGWADGPASRSCQQTVQQRRRATLPL